MRHGVLVNETPFHRDAVLIAFGVLFCYKHFAPIGAKTEKVIK
jgi:hypothetical protein